MTTLFYMSLLSVFLGVLVPITDGYTYQDRYLPYSPARAALSSRPGVSDHVSPRSSRALKEFSFSNASPRATRALKELSYSNASPRATRALKELSYSNASPRATRALRELSYSNASPRATKAMKELSYSNANFTELPETLLSVNNLGLLAIRDTQIKTWNLDIIKHLGATLKTLFLSNVGLTSWPTWIQYLPRLSKLELTRAFISLPDNAFDVQINTLYSLNLENGILTEIPRAVTKLTLLQSLFLDSNDISLVAGIPNSPVLSKLSISNNKISDAEQLSKALRSVAGSLSILMFNNNQLTQLPDLSGMAKLSTVYMSGNPISYIGSSKIPPSLQNLGIERCNLQSLDSFMHNGLSLAVLEIQFNSIKEIIGSDVPANVEHMDISFNLVTELTDESFPPNSNMDSLTLNSNPISTVSEMAFARFSKLTYLSMTDTKITRLPLSLTYITKMVRVDLTGNDKLICTCLEKSLRSWVLLYPVFIYGQCGVTTIDNFLKVMSNQCPN